MSESKNITIMVGSGSEESNMMPLIQDYPDYMATYNMEDANADFFTTTLNKYDSNIYTFFKPGVSFAKDDAIVQIAKAFEKDPAVMAVVCDGFSKHNSIKHPYYLDTNRLTNINDSIPISFHKNIVKQLTFQEDVYKTLVDTLNSCISKQVLIIHIAEPLVVINE
jgi:hypothetical protein|tara:strand:- start:1851 stop:2345 length:495 start_codon:yes stop_codon:yes gene_type:complete